MATQAIAAQGMMGVSRDTDGVAERNTMLLAAQRRSRRGPTPEALFAKRLDNTRLVKADDPHRVREMRSFACAMAFLLSLALAYGWQHFSAIEYGYRMEAQKQQLQLLEEQNRQLRLSEAQLSEPSRIDTMARNLGLTTPHPGQVVHPGAGITDGSAPTMAKVTPAIPAIH